MTLPPGFEACYTPRPNRVHARLVGSHRTICGADSPGDALVAAVNCQRCNYQIGTSPVTVLKRPLPPVRTRDLKQYTLRVIRWMDALGLAREVFKLKRRVEVCTKHTHFRQVLHAAICDVASARHGRCECAAMPHETNCYLMSLAEIEGWSDQNWGVNRHYHQRSPHQQGRHAEVQAEMEWEMQHPTEGEET